MASSPATAPPPDSNSPSTNSTSPPLPEALTPPPPPPPPASAPPPSSPPPSSPPPSLPPPSSPPPSSPPPTSPLPSSPPPLHFPPPPPASSPPLPASSPPPPNLSPPPQYSPPPPPDSPQNSSPPPPAPSSPAPIFFSPPPLSPNGSPPPSPALPPPLPTSPTPPPSSKGSPPPPTTLPPPSPPSPTPPSSFKPPPSSDGFLPPPPPKRAEEAPPHSSPSTNDYNVDSKKSSGGSHVNLPMVAGIAAGIALFFLIIGLVACVCCRKKKKKVEKKKMSHNSINNYPDPGVKGNNYYNIGAAPPKWNNGGQEAVAKLPPPPGMAWNPRHSPAAINTENSVSYSEPNGPPLGFVKSAFSYEELAAATNGFSEENILGQGGFGYVHKGILPNGQEVAVKQLKAGSGQGEREFQAEVEIISRVHHRHLVSLVGYCIFGSQRLLVYEFVPNKTLEFHLHGKDQPTMDWPTRMRIALGSAKGLAYLHEDCHPRIIHRDIKASNILLDYRFEAKVADFGLAKLSSDNYTHISTRVMGTFGYLAPEYASSGKLSEKSDVFSFGVMLLELITGKRPVHSNPMEDSLVDWARPLLTQALTDENYEELVDPRLEGNYSQMEMARMVACAATSVRHSAKMRPKMSQIVRALEGDSSLEDLTEGVRPGQSMQFTSSSEHESGSYASNMSRLRRAAFNSNDLSQEYSGLTSDYGLNPSSSSSSEEVSTVMPHPDKAGLEK